MLGDFADVQQTVGAGNDLHEGAKLGQANDLAQISLAYFGNGREVVDHLNGFLRGRAIAGSNVDFAGIVHVDLDAGLVDDAANHLAAGANQVADLVRRNVQGVNARSEVGDVLASAGDRLFHLVENVEPATARLLHGFVHDLGRDADDLDVHLQRGNSFARAGDFKVHIAVVVFCSGNVGEDSVGVRLFHQTHGHSGHSGGERHAGVHQR